jgi:short-subunit dehydrogenase
MAERPLALVTGASSGIGEAFARRLARDGWDLALVARRRDRLQALAGALSPAKVEIIEADLGTDDGVARVVACAAGKPLAMLVNNAGLAHYMPFVDLPEEKASELVRVNVLAPTLIARATLPGMVKRGKGTVVNVASLLAWSGSANFPGFPKRAVYAGTGSYIVTFTEILANELAGTGVRVQALCPGVVKTEFHTRQGMDLSSRPRMEPDDVVQASLAGLELGEIVCVPPLEDADAVKRVQEGNGGMLKAAQNTKLAERYR